MAKTDNHPLHGLSPYVGRLATPRALDLINRFGKPGGILADPFCGSGTIPLEAWKSGMKVIASDLSPYAMVLTRAKLFPIQDSDTAIEKVNFLSQRVKKRVGIIDLRKVPIWVRNFYHPETLREAIAWAQVLKEGRYWFLFGCFLNILHHQRPGFLSYPASHATPYLRGKQFPEDRFPELYAYRDIKSRLIKKISRTLKEPLQLDFCINRKAKRCNALKLPQNQKKVDCIVTSPPYMSGLDYARDNRLRLWFCGVANWTDLEPHITPTRTKFTKLIKRCAQEWQFWVKPNGHIAIVLGDIHRDNRRVDVARLVKDTFKKEASSLILISCEDQAIPDEKRLIKRNAGTKTETTLIFKRKN